MSQRIERPPLRVRPGSSRLLGTFVVAVYGLALATLYLSPLTSMQQGAMVAVVVMGCIWGIAGQVLHRLPWSLREAIWRPDGGWSLILASGNELEGRLLASTYVSPLLVVLRFRCGFLRTCSLLLLPDNLGSDDLRRLRVRLRLTGIGPSDDSKAGT